MHAKTQLRDIFLSGEAEKNRTWVSEMTIPRATLDCSSRLDFLLFFRKEVLKQITQKEGENVFASYNLTVIDGQRADYLKIWSC